MKNLLNSPLTVDFEKDLSLHFKSKWIIGCDEVGRGSLAGPVVACGTAIMPEALSYELDKLGIKDSKTISHKKRLKILRQLLEPIAKKNIQKLNLFPEFNGFPKDNKKIINYYFNGIMGFCVEAVSANRIDKINIAKASLEAMKKASTQLIYAIKAKAENNNSKITILLDGNAKFNFNEKIDFNDIEIASMVKGDSKSLAIAISAIIAKEFRDNLMGKLGKKYPQMCWEKNAAYPTKKHKEAIANHGITKHHRKSFNYQ